jgi:hypothetical protein
MEDCMECCIESGLPRCGVDCKKSKGFLVQDIPMLIDTRCDDCCGRCFKGEKDEESSSVSKRPSTSS